MTTLKSRTFECPQEIMTALLNLHIAQKNLTLLARKLDHQSTLFDDDVMTTVLQETADEIELYTQPIKTMADDFAMFINSLD